MKRRRINTACRTWYAKKFGRHDRLTHEPKITAFQIAMLCRPKSPDTPPPKDRYEHLLNGLIDLNQSARASTANSSGKKRAQRMRYSSDTVREEFGKIGLITRIDRTPFNTPKLHVISPSVKRKQREMPVIPLPKDKHAHCLPESKYLMTKHGFAASIRGYEQDMLKIGISHHLRKKYRTENMANAEFHEIKYSNY